MTKTLQLNFKTEGGKNVMLTVDAPREDLTAEIVGNAMQEIINSAVFMFDDYPLETAINARVVERTVTNLIEG